MRALIVNVGSASVKLRVLDGTEHLVAAADLGSSDGQLASHLEDFLADVDTVDVVGHRVVHGGPSFSVATLVDDETREAIQRVTELAPLHNPPALAGIDAARRLLPQVPSIACFDTGFHATLPPAATTYAVPADWVSRWGFRRYGFHGLSCAWAARRAAQLLGRSPEGLRLVICHLGGGASVSAVRDGRSVDTTMGFTPMEGLVMATRCGDLDPGALLFALTHGLAASDAEDALERRSGLLGLSGGSSSDIRQLLTARGNGDDKAQLAIAVYVHRLRAKIAAMTAATGGTDAVIFTGGVGEHSAAIRAETAVSLDWLGVSLDLATNDAVGESDADISGPGVSVRTLVIHAREDLQIASECRRLLQEQAGRPY